MDIPLGTEGHHSMKIKTKKFSSGDLARILPYRTTSCSVREPTCFELMEGFKYLIHLEDGRQISGVFCKKGIDNSMVTQEDIQLDANISEGRHISMDQVPQNDTITPHCDVERDSWKIFTDKSYIPSDHIESPKLVTLHDPHIKMSASISSESQQFESDKTHSPTLEKKKQEYSFEGSLQPQEEMTHELLVSEHSSLLKIPSNASQIHRSKVQQDEHFDVAEIQCEMSQHCPIKLDVLQVNLDKQSQQIVLQDVNITNHNGNVQRNKTLSQCVFSNRAEELEDIIPSTVCNIVQQNEALKVLVDEHDIKKPCHHFDAFQVPIPKKNELIQQNNEHIEMDIDALAHNEIQGGVAVSQSNTFSSLDGARHPNTCSQQVYIYEQPNDTLFLQSGLLSHDVEHLKKQVKSDISSKCDHSFQQIPESSTIQSEKVEEQHPFQVVNQLLENSFQNSMISQHFQDPLAEGPEQQQLENVDDMICMPMSLTNLEILPQVTKSSQQGSDVFPCQFNNYQPSNNQQVQVKSEMTSSYSETNVLMKQLTIPAHQSHDLAHKNSHLHNPDSLVNIRKEHFEAVSLFQESMKQSSETPKLSYQSQEQVNILHQNVMQEADVNMPQSGIEQQLEITYQKTLNMQPGLKTPQSRDEHIPELQEKIHPQTGKIIGAPLFHFNSNGMATPLLSSGPPFPKMLMLKEPPNDDSQERMDHGLHCSETTSGLQASSSNEATVVKTKTSGNVEVKLVDATDLCSTSQMVDKNIMQPTLSTMWSSVNNALSGLLANKSKASLRVKTQPTLSPTQASPVVSICTVAPSAKSSTLKSVSSPMPILQGKNPIFITPNQFKALANICRQNCPKATALVVPNTHMRPLEDVVHILSSDDEDEVPIQPNKTLQAQPSQLLSTTGICDINNSEFLLHCPLRQAFFGRGRGGVLRMCHLALEFIRLTSLNCSSHFDIPLREVTKMSIHHGLCGPVFFLKVTEKVQRLVGTHFSFDTSIFDPFSPDLGKCHILLIPSKKNSVERDNLGHSTVMKSLEIIAKHLSEKFGSSFDISTLSGSETSELIGSVLNVTTLTKNIPAHTGSVLNQTCSIPTQVMSSVSQSLSSPASTITAATSAQGMQHTAQLPSFVIVGGNHPINIVGSNNINITNNIFNINVPNNTIRTGASIPKAQIIVLAKKLSGISTSERTQEPRKKGPIVSLFTYPPAPGPGRMTITTEDYYCLNEGELLNDNIIDFYLKYFLEEHLDETIRNSVHLFSSFFYGKMVAEDRTQDAAAGSSQTPQQVRHSRVKTWTRHVDLFGKDFIIIPIIESSHWFLAVVCFPGLKSPVIEHYQASNSDVKQEPVIRLKQPCILIFDSLGMVGHQTVTKTLREYLQEEWNLKKQDVEGAREFSENTFPGFNPNCPQQNNSTDCGVFVLKYVESFFRKPIKDFIMPISNTAEWFTHDAIRDKRKEIQQLIMQLHNEDKQNK